LLRTIIAGSGMVLALFGVAACGSSHSANSAEQAKQASQQDMYSKNQPIPLWPSSALRGTLITVEDAEVHGVATTTFFFNMGVQDPVLSCPSLGFPLASTAQLSNPQQVVNTYNNNAGTAIPQQEPNGIYTGDSTGTYVVCARPDGSKSIDYWEGFVYTVGGPAHWDAGTHTVVVDGAATVKGGTGAPK
jgi:hypothetical protein